MYNLNDVNCSSGSGPEYGKLAIDQTDNTTTPKTPEIINSLMAITNPLDEYSQRRSEDKLFSPTDGSTTFDGCSSASSTLGSPTSPNSVQNMRSQFIKEGLKLTLQKRRNAQPEDVARYTKYDESSLEEDDNSSSYGEQNGGQYELTPEDEERRRRRRERNKIAATKCRLKKRERTVNLVQESEVLETQNYDLKTQIKDLEVQRRRLVSMLTEHKPTCSKPSPDQSPVVDYQQPPNFLSGVTPYTASMATKSPDMAVLYEYPESSPFVGNPSVMLSGDKGKLKLKTDEFHHLKPMTNIDSNFNFIDRTEFDFDSSYTLIDSINNSCLV